MNQAIPLAERLRPQTLSDLVGQEHLSGNNSVLQNAIQKGKVPSMILWGPPGVGKTTLANIISTTFNSAYFQLSAISSGVKELREVIEEAKTLNGAIVFIDEIHRFNKGQQDALLGAVEKGIITLIGATTRAGMLTNPLRDRFGIISRLEFYTPEELCIVVKRSARLLNMSISEDGAIEIAKRSRGTPRIANRLLRRVRDYAEVKSDGNVSKIVADQALNMLDVDQLGLDLMDRKLLLAIIEKFDCGPVGLDNLAATIGESPDTIEDVIEPYLMQNGLLQRTPRGRIATKHTLLHFGFTANE